MNILALIALTVANWLLRACGQEVGQVFRPANPEIATHLKLTRDRYGRFRPKDAPLPEPGTTEAILEDAGITPRMQKAAPVPLALPDDIHETETFQRHLREYVAHNLDAWITGRSCSVGMAFAALMNTYAIDRRRVQLLLDELRLARAQQSALAGRTGLPVRNGVPVRTEVKGNTWIAYPPPVATPTALNSNVDTRVGAGPAPARDEQGYAAAYHRATENTEQDELRAFSHLAHPSRCLGGEEQTSQSTEPHRAASNPAGGCKVLTYADRNTAPEDDNLDLSAIGAELAPIVAAAQEKYEARIASGEPVPPAHTPCPVRSARHQHAAAGFGAADSLSAYGTMLGKEIPYAASDFRLSTSDFGNEGSNVPVSAAGKMPALRESSRPPPHHLHLLDPP